MTKEEFIQIHPDYRTYADKHIHVIAHPQSCFFCKNLTDYVFDSHGPYLFLCKHGTDKEDPTDEGIKGECQLFERSYEHG